MSVSRTRAKERQTPAPGVICGHIALARPGPEREAVPWTVGQMALLAGMRVRRPQEGFRKWDGCTPTEYLAGVRLQWADADLATDPDAKVSDVAARWGPSSASRFAAAYRWRYRRTPSRGNS